MNQFFGYRGLEFTVWVGHFLCFGEGDQQNQSQKAKEVEKKLRHYRHGLHGQRPGMETVSTLWGQCSAEWEPYPHTPSILNVNEDDIDLALLECPVGACC